MKPYAKNCRKIVEDGLNNGSIERWAGAGATDRQIAENLGISYSKYNQIKTENVKLVETVQRARRPVVTEAFNGLVRLSQGWHEKVTKRHIRKVKDADGKVISSVEEITEDDVYVAPQHQACTKVIVNYLRQLEKGGGIPQEYLTEPSPVAQEQRNGRLEEMDKALAELFFGEKK